MVQKRAKVVQFEPRKNPELKPRKKAKEGPVPGPLRPIKRARRRGSKSRGPAENPLGPVLSSQIFEPQSALNRHFVPFLVPKIQLSDAKEDRKESVSSK